MSWLRGFDWFAVDEVAVVVVEDKNVVVPLTGWHKEFTSLVTEGASRCDGNNADVAGMCLGTVQTSWTVILHDCS